jgi:hypothetical protein
MKTAPAIESEGGEYGGDEQYPHPELGAHDRHAEEIEPDEHDDCGGTQYGEGEEPLLEEAAPALSREEESKEYRDGSDRQHLLGRRVPRELSPQIPLGLLFRGRIRVLGHHASPVRRSIVDSATPPSRPGT